MYNVDLQDLAEMNNIIDAGLIKADSIIFVPDAYHTEDAEHPEKNLKTPVEESQSSSGERIASYPEKSPKTPVEESKSSSKKKVSAKRDVKQVFRDKRGGKQLTKLRFDKKRFMWPVKGKVISKFGIQRSGMKYNGINISASEGAPVVAAADGTVNYSAPLRYFGDTIIIKHKDRYATVYSHLKDRKVKAGDSVKKGDQIALLGKPENSSRPYVHFEIRRSNKPRNPLFFLP